MNINRDSESTFQQQNIKDNDSSKIITQNLINKPQEGPSKKLRLNALDVHRGLTMMGMILVDHQQDLFPYWWIKHADWNGFTPADLVFPSFVFIMGMAVPLAVNLKNPIRIKTVIRIFALILIGILLEFLQALNFNTFRIPGIMQRLGLCYGFTIMIHVATNYGQKERRVFGVFFVLLLGALYLAFMIPFQNLSIDCPASKNLSEFCNFGGYTDRAIFTENHMIYPNDPEGLFTTLNAVITAYAGYYFSLTMFDYKSNIKTVLIRWTIFSLIFGLIAYPLTFLMPLNKKIWSTSYTFLTAGVAGLCLAFLVFFVDVVWENRPIYRKVIHIVTQPFIWLGRNPLAIFIMMNFFMTILDDYIKINDQSLLEWLYFNAIASWINIPQIASMLFSFLFVVLWAVVAGVMFRFNLFIRL